MGSRRPKRGLSPVQLTLVKRRIESLWRVGGRDILTALAVVHGWSKVQTDNFRRTIQNELSKSPDPTHPSLLEAASILFIASFLRPTLPKGWNSGSHNYEDGNRPSPIRRSLTNCAGNLPNRLPRDTPAHAELAIKAIGHFMIIDSIVCAFDDHAFEFERDGLKTIKMLLGKVEGARLARNLLDRLSEPTGLIGVCPVILQPTDHDRWLKRVRKADARLRR